MPPTESSRLQSRAIRLAATGDRLSARFARQLGRVLREVERGVADILRSQEPSTGALVRAAQGQAVRNQIEAVLAASGYRELVQASTGLPFDRIAASQQRIAGPIAGTLRVDAIRHVHLLELLGEGQRMTETLQRAAVRGLVGSVPRGTVIRDIGRVIDRSDAQIATLYDTTLSIYGREIEAITANPSRRTKFVYLGPVDASTRPFCLQYVGRVLERQEIDTLDNGMLGQPFLTGGGFNCRHVWTEISEASDLVPLHRSRGRIPEVVDDVRSQRRDRAA